MTFRTGPTRRVIPSVLKIVALVVFAQTLFTRAVDPVITKIAADLVIDVKAAALLSTAFTLPYALVQPIIGITGDFFGKTRVMNICAFVVSIAALVCAVSDSFSLLVAMRVLGGLVAGGVFPVAMALIGDLTFPIVRSQAEGIATVSEGEIASAMRLIWEVMKIAVEPSGAVGYAAVAGKKLPVAGRRVGVILSGGNVEFAGSG